MGSKCLREFYVEVAFRLDGIEGRQGFEVGAQGPASAIFFAGLSFHEQCVLEGVLAEPGHNPLLELIYTRINEYEAEA